MKRNELRHERHTISILTDHLVFCPKYRGKVLVGEVRDYAEEVIKHICREMGIDIICMFVSSEHVHIFFKYPPKHSVSYIGNIIKGKSSRLLRQKFPHLQKLCKDLLWAPSCFHGSVGHGWKVVEKYISTQKDYSLDRGRVYKRPRS